MKLEVIKGDITKLEVDAIVNAANSSLLGGGGVDGAIHRAGGHEILKECQKIRNTYGGCKAGHAVITTAGKLKAKKVIHTVGPIYTEGSAANAALKLKSCYIESLKLAQEHNLKTLAFPNISTGVYRYPKDEACGIAINTVRSFKSDRIEKVIFVCFDDENYKLYSVILN